MELFKNKYRIPSARLQTWNYSNAGMYFITICTRNRECYFGSIADNEMQLSEIGKAAESNWLKTVELRPDMNLELAEFQVMPNHFHSIITIGDNQYNRDTIDPNNGKKDKIAPNGKSNAFGPQSKNLSSILRGYKSAVTVFANEKEMEFGWQPRFHDHIIRSMDEYYRIADYIINNVANWQADKFYSK